MAEGHGGRRTPANPAPVSNPQSGARTDGGPGSRSQPIRVPAGGSYGQRQAAEALQGAAPLPDETGAGPVNPGGGAPQGLGPQAPPPLPSLTAPTNRPNEPITAGARMPDQNQMPDPDLVLRVLYDKTHNPYIARLIRNRHRR